VKPALAQTASGTLAPVLPCHPSRPHTCEGNGLMIEASKRYGRVRRDALDDPYWVERFMFARRVTSDLLADGENRRTNRSGTVGRRTAVHILETLAGVLIRRGSR
jgi:hypothetical protein